MFSLFQSCCSVQLLTMAVDSVEFVLRVILLCEYVCFIVIVINHVTFLRHRIREGKSNVICIPPCRFLWGKIN